MIADSAPGHTGVWHHLSLTHKGLAVVGSPIAILAVGFGFFTARALEEQSIRGDLRQTIRVRSTVHALVRDALSAESAGRAFLVDPTRDFRASCLAATERVAEDARKLEEVSAGSEVGRDRFRDLKELLKQKAMAEAMLVADAGTAFTDPGRAALLRHYAAMEALRHAAESIDAAAERQQGQDLAVLERAHDRTLAAGGITIVLGLIVTFSATILFTRSVSRRLRDLQMSARALKTEAPLRPEAQSADEIGQLGAELERASETLAHRLRELRVSEGQMRSILDQTTAIIYIKDLESRYVLVNHAYERAFGVKAEEVIGRSSVDIYGPTHGAALRRHDQAVIRTKRPQQFAESMKAKGRVYNYVSVKAPLFDIRGEIYGVCGISTDITLLPLDHLDRPEGGELELVGVAPGTGISLDGLVDA